MSLKHEPLTVLIENALKESKLPTSVLSYVMSKLLSIFCEFTQLWQGEFSNLNELEDKTRHMSMTLSSLFITLFLWRKDLFLEKQSSGPWAQIHCPCCGNENMKKRVLSRTMKTTCSEVKIFRSEIRCPKCHWHKIPLEEELGIPSKIRVSSRLSYWLCQVGASLPYQISAKFFGDWLGENLLSNKTVHEHCNRVGFTLLKKESSIEQVKAYPEEPDQIVIDADAAVVDRHRSVRKKDGSKHQRFEVWVGRTYVKTSRYRNQVNYEGLAYTGGCQHAGDNIPGLFANLLLQRFPKAKVQTPVYVRGDGGAMVDSIAEIFPCSQRLLDQYHGLVKISERIKEAFPFMSRNKRQELGDNLGNLLRAGETESLLKGIDALKENKNVEKQEPINKLYEYYKKHDKHLWYPKCKDLGMSVGTGIAEKDVDLLLDRRYELRGMSWSPKGVRNNLRIRLCMFNQRLDALEHAC